MSQLQDSLTHRYRLPIRGAMQRVYQRLRPPVVFMHVPKTGGAALIAELQTSLGADRMVRGFDRCLFGGFDAFDTMSHDERARVFLDPEDLPYRAELVVGHMALSTLQAAYPTGRLITVLREPVCRLLSHWTYWRACPDDRLYGLGDWAEVVRTARGTLTQFLDDPRAACQTDNVTTRMLLWPHPLIPDDGFIDPTHDAALVAAAQERLAEFAAVDITELPDRTAATRRLGHRLGRLHGNATEPVGSALLADLHGELTPYALDRLEACARLDARLWAQVAGEQLGHATMERLRNRALLLATARHAALLRGVAP